jgi:hypothetical protein
MVQLKRLPPTVHSAAKRSLPAYDTRTINPAFGPFLALLILLRMYNLWILKPVGKFGSRRLHQLIYFHAFRCNSKCEKSIADVVPQWT